MYLRPVDSPNAPSAIDCATICAHARELVGGGGAVGRAHHALADGVVPGEERDVHPEPFGARAVEVAAERTGAAAIRTAERQS